MWKNKGFIFALVGIFVLFNFSSCAFIEDKFLIPKSTVKIAVKENNDPDRVFNCLNNTISFLRKNAVSFPRKSRTSIWGQNLAKVNNQLFQTRDFDEFNIIHIRIRANYLLDEKIVILELKASGPFYADIGIDKELENLAYGTKNCLFNINSVWKRGL